MSEDKSKQEREAFEAWYDTQWQNNGDTTSEAAWMARAALSQPQAGGTLSDAEINDATLERLGKWPSFEAQSWACKVVHAILARSTADASHAAPGQGLTDEHRQALAMAAVALDRVAYEYEYKMRWPTDAKERHDAAAVIRALLAAPAAPASKEKCAHEYRVEPPYGMRCKTCGQFQDDEKSTTPAPAAQADDPVRPETINAAFAAKTTKLPEGWVPLRIEYEPGDPEDVAYGPQRLMDRLKKWLDKYFELRAAQQSATPGVPVAEVAAGNLGNRLMWHTEDAQSLTPVGTPLYAHPDPLLAECVGALEKFVSQWNACGPNSDFGRYFANVRTVAVATLAKVQAAKGERK